VGLQEYKAKRSFPQTPEPAGAVASGEGPLRFVVQKHKATRLHFDFRIEAEGTLKSWAVPKGPSYQSHEKRLAVMVEDHPLDYLLFEGIIPKGNYGAGTVMVWDVGTYHVPGVLDREKCDQQVREGLRNGSLHLVLHGKKLSGEFGLVKMKKAEKNEWLFFRKSPTADRPAKEDLSAISGRTMEEITAGAAPSEPAQTFDLTDAPEAPMPRNIRPMLATPVEKPFDNDNWLFEVKWDGYRAIAEVDGERVRLYSRKNLPFENRFDTIVTSLGHLGHQAVLDGEVVVLDASGKPRFQLLQGHQSTRRGTLVYEVFDLLYLDGHDLRKLPLTRRKELLKQLAQQFEGVPNIHYSEAVAGHGIAFYNAVSENGLEGVVAKDRRSRYLEGVRGSTWLKIKTLQQQEAVIAGFTEPRGSRSGLGSLVLGVYDGGELVHIGRAGTGFDEKSLAFVRSRLDPLVQAKCPFKKVPKTDTRAHWVRPELVCEVSFAEWSDDGHLRFPVFLGLREDTDPLTVKRERPEPEPPPIEPVPAPQPVVVAGQKGRTQVEIDGQNVSLSNLQKIFWPEDGYTKGDLIDYYRSVAHVIVPYLRDRPESLNRHPNGINGMNFFQKDVSRQPPPTWVKTVEIISDSDGDRSQTLLCQDEATLVYLANLGCIELNPWHARVASLNQADYAMLDLDPERIAFDRVVETAQMIRKVLNHAGAEGVCKTSGKRGLHIYVPFGAAYSHEQAKRFAELIAHIVNAKLPAITSLARNPIDRQERVYLDFLQNGKGKTLAAPYSVRPYAKATVSAPLKWTEVKKGLDPGKFTIRTMAKRLDSVGDLWKPVLGPGIDLPDCLQRLASALKKI
jgi:bifunctional non-homologous end joining protein LigD